MYMGDFKGRTPGLESGRLIWKIFRFYMATLALNLICSKMIGGICLLHPLRALEVCFDCSSANL